MEAGKRSLVIAAKRALHRVDIGVSSELIEQCDSGSGLLALLVAEARICVNEEGIDGAQNERKQPGVLWLCSVTPIHKNVLTSRMPVKVAEQLQFSFLRELEHQLLRVVNCRVQHLTRLLPSSIEVAPRE